MTDPRLPETKRKEAQLPDALDQQVTPDAGAHGSEDAQLLAEAGQQKSDVERAAPSEVND